MRNPFASEIEAFHFLWLTIAAFAAVAVASIAGGPWAGVPAWIVVTVAAVAFYARRARAPRTVKTAPAHVGAVDDRRILVLANEALTNGKLAQEIERAAHGGHNEVRVVCPALTSPANHWASDLGGARAKARQRLDETLDQLHALGVDARGEIGDEDPLLAIEDALRTFGADEIIISAPSAPDIAVRARERFALPVSNVVV